MRVGGSSKQNTKTKGENDMEKVGEMLKELGLNKAKLMRMLAEKRPKPKILKRAITDKILRFGIVSDTHLCSIHERLDELHTFYEICRKEGIQYVLHSGDLIDGSGLYTGQENEIHTFGLKRQAQYVVDRYPKVDGIETIFVTGNHDLVYYKNAGADVGECITEKRPDMRYVGRDKADIELGGIRIQLLHPGGATAYADSYHLQRTISSFEGGSKPQILICGHYHRSLYLFSRNIHGFLGGTFQGQTVFQLRKRISPVVGGWTVKCHIAKDNHNSVVAISPTWIPFFADTH